MIKSKNKYRIVRDNYAGYEVQIKRWWFPFWIQVDFNTHYSIECAESYARNHAYPFAKDVEL